jgi:hypothetical protein
VFSYSNFRDLIRFDQSFWNSGVSILAMIRVTTTLTVRVNYTLEPHKAHDLYRPAARPRASLPLLHQTGESREFTTYSLHL